jgi:hypothetical protein
MVLLCGSVSFPLWFGLLVMIGLATLAFGAYAGLKALGLRICGWRPRRTFMRDAALLTLASVSGGLIGTLGIAFLVQAASATWENRFINGTFNLVFLFGILATLIDSAVLRRWARWRAAQALNLDPQGQLLVEEGRRPAAIPWISAIVTNAVIVGLIVLGTHIFA